MSNNRSYVLHIENFLKVEKASINLDPGVIGLVGNNAQGKTTFIHALHDLMTGKNDFSKIRDGQEKATVRIDVMENGELVSTIARTQTKDKMKLEGSGLRPGQTPIGFLASLMDEVAVNPITLATSNPVAYLKQHLDVKIEPTDFTEEMTKLINEFSFFQGKEQAVKTKGGFELAELLAGDMEVNRKATGDNVKNTTAMIAEMKKQLPPEQPGLPHDEDQLKKEQDAILENIRTSVVKNANHGNAKRTRDRLVAELDGMEQGLKNLDTERANLMAQVAKVDGRIEQMKNTINVARETTLAQADQELKNNPLIDTAAEDAKARELTQKIEHVQMVKKVQQGFKALFEREALLKALQDTYAKQDRIVKFFRYELPKVLIAKCKLPVEGIEFRDGEMFVGGHHIERLSTAEKAVVTTKIAIAIAKQKGHVAVCLDGVESMDEAHRAEFLKAADESGMCILYTRFGKPEYPHEKEVVGGKILN